MALTPNSNSFSSFSFQIVICFRWNPECLLQLFRGYGPLLVYPEITEVGKLFEPISDVLYTEKLENVTPGGYNEQAMNELMGNGAIKAWRTTLDNLFERLQKSAKS